MIRVTWDKQTGFISTTVGQMNRDMNWDTEEFWTNLGQQINFWLKIDTLLVNPYLLILKLAKKSKSDYNSRTFISKAMVIFRSPKNRKCL